MLKFNVKHILLGSALLGTDIAGLQCEYRD